MEICQFDFVWFPNKKMLGGFFLTHFELKLAEQFDNLAQTRLVTFKTFVILKILKFVINIWSKFGHWVSSNFIISLYFILFYNFKVCHWNLVMKFGDFHLPKRSWTQQFKLLAVPLQHKWQTDRKPIPKTARLFTVKKQENCLIWLLNYGQTL